MLFLLQASFFIAYVVTSGWTSTASELFRLFPLISIFMKKKFAGKDDDDFEVPSVPYHGQIPKIALFGLLGVTYFFLAPLILPFLLVYYCLGYIVFCNQVCWTWGPFVLFYRISEYTVLCLNVNERRTLELENFECSLLLCLHWNTCWHISLLDHQS